MGSSAEVVEWLKSDVVGEIYNNLSMFLSVNAHLDNARGLLWSWWWILLCFVLCVKSLAWLNMWAVYFLLYLDISDIENLYNYLLLNFHFSSTAKSLVCRRFVLF